ncbi:hypothetical protein IFR04_011312 [Cadophora malorum]|uniref:Alkylmercury lyase n=1 Tax=Cadophora malorum TaxID=108018 RepID=A0A8H7TB17_9HELO|nr:hypothetical protein IFR04_011312 [Cadophora malorum]
MAQPKTVQVQLLCVPDCPLVESVRSTLKKSLARVPVDHIVEVLVGDYSSPTILVNGFDVTGCPRAPEGQMSCRLDLPTEEQIIAALRGFIVLRYEGSLADQLQALLQTAKPVSADGLMTRTETSLHVTLRYVKK